jgi:alginate O-acetyltransferase complex protein AlgI
MIIVIIGWVVFRAASLSDAWAMYSGMLGFNGWHISADQAWQIQNLELTTLVVGGVISIFGPTISIAVQMAPNAIRTSGNIGLLATACAALIAQTHSPFLYFQF